MKVFELLREDVPVVSEEQLEKRLRAFDWKYEFDDNMARMAWGSRELELIENLVYRLWKTAPDTAIALWNNCVPGVVDKTVVPSFIFRLQSQEHEPAGTS